MTIYIVCLKHKRAIYFVDILKVFTNLSSANTYKIKFNEHRPEYALASIITYEEGSL